MPVARTGRPPHARSRKLSKGAAGRSAADGATLETAQATVGAFLRATRERLHLTQSEVAARTREWPWQLSRAAVSAIERGQNFPGLEAMLALSNVLQIDPKEMIERARLAAVVPVDISGIDDRELESRASQLFWAGDYRRALAVYDAMAEKLALEDHAAPERLAERMAGLEIRRATALKRAGALISAIASAERAIVVSAKLPQLQADAYVVLADLQVQRGHLPLARDAAARAIELAGEAGNTKGMAWAFLVKGRVHFLERQYEAALAAFFDARRGIERGGDARHLTHVEGNIGMCYLALGDAAKARGWVERAAGIAHEHGQPALEASWLVELGKLALAAGQLDDADAHTRAAARTARRLDHALTKFRVEWLRHRIARARKPDAPDPRRLAVLRGLYAQLDQHEGIDEIREYKSAMLSATHTKGER